MKMNYENLLIQKYSLNKLCKHQFISISVVFLFVGAFDFDVNILGLVVFQDG